jgi:glycosyltransferase involved in cell wall biosynthesis
VRDRWRGEPCELLLAVHVEKSADSVLAAAAIRPAPRIAVLLAGTDVYPVFRPGGAAERVLEAADAVIALQPNASAVLPPHLRGKVRTIVQSATPMTPPPNRFERFTACVLAHLRPVKAPLLPFEAMACIPPEVRLDLRVAGGALEPEMATAARAAAARDPRCSWLGELPRREARTLLHRSQLCVVPSTSEGGANVISEAIAARTPVLASAIPGNTGLLGEDWPGLFPSGDREQLARLLITTATDFDHYNEMVRRTEDLQDLVSPAREREQLRALVTDLGVRLPQLG